VVTLRLVGRLGGPEARERARARNAVGLTQAHRSGDTLVGGATSGAIVDEIIAGSGIENGSNGEAGAVRDGLSGRVHAVFGS
jgi:hypothetical protein